MQKRIYFLALVFLLADLTAMAQTSTPAVPERVTFADISVRFDTDARRIVQQDVDALLANRQYWTAKLDRVALYFPLIEAILLEENLPTDFKYLAVQESSLTPDAVSSSSAVGYWQFKRETATGNGLRVDNEIDERKSITASTRGAATYLKKNNTQFNNWVSSLYSYYLGAGGIARLVPPDWAYAREITLNGQTDRYILRFFAHKIAIESALKFHQASNRFALIEYANGGGKTIPAIAEELGVDEFELRKYNRWLLSEAVPTDKVYVMVIPVLNDRINDVRQKIVSISGKKTPGLIQNDVGFPVLRRVAMGTGRKGDPVLYEINELPGIQAQVGDNAASLARKARISTSSFLRYNDMDDTDPVLTGDVYYLAKKRKKAQVPFHTVRADETVRSISQRYGVRLKKLLRNNRLDRTQKLAVGRVMWLRERRPANKAIEIINSPTPPVYDQTPGPAVREVAGNRPAERSPANPLQPVTGSEGVPRNPTERRLYQPKLVGGGVTPNDGTSEPATVQRSEPTRPARQPARAPAPASVPAPTMRPGAPMDADGSQRVIIVRSSNQAATDSAATVMTPVPGRSQPAGTSVALPRRTESVAERPQRASRPTERPTTERGSYDGPREQQADGSLTVPSVKAPPRPPAPEAVKPESRPSVEVAIAEPRPPAPTPPVATRSTPAVPMPANRSSVTVHTVEPGQTYYSIARQYGLTVDELLATNGRTINNVLEAGQRLTIRATSTGDPAPLPRTAPVSGPADVIYHTVAKGETMFRISKTYGVTIEQIQNWNNLTDVTVKEGQRLKVNGEK